MKNNTKLFSVLLMMLSSVATFATEQPDIKNEIPVLCPSPLKLRDGYYVAVAAGYDVYQMVDSASYRNNNALFNMDPALAINGMIGDFVLGYSKLFGKNSNIYLGLELFANGSAADSDFQTTLPAMPVIIDTDVIVNGSFGVGILPGFRINNTSIVYLKFGYSWSIVSIDETLRVQQGGDFISREYNDEVTTDGFLYAVGLESAVSEQFSVRAEYSYTPYHSFHTKSAATINNSRNQYLLGLVYHFPANK